MLSSSGWTPRANHDKPFCNAFERWHEIHSWYSWWLFAHVLHGGCLLMFCFLEIDLHLHCSWFCFCGPTTPYVSHWKRWLRPLLKSPRLGALVFSPWLWDTLGVFLVLPISFRFNPLNEPLVRSGFALHIPHPLPVNIQYSIFSHFSP